MDGHDERDDDNWVSVGEEIRENGDERAGQLGRPRLLLRDPRDAAVDSCVVSSSMSGRCLSSPLAQRRERRSDSPGIFHFSPDTPRPCMEQSACESLLTEN